MKYIFNVDKESQHINFGLLIGRVGIAALMLTHGIPKFIMLFSDDSIKFAPIMGLSSELSLSLAIFAEVICSFFLLLGFATRLAVIPLMTTMLTAILFVHTTGPFSDKEPALLYLLAYLVLLFMGSGKYSMDFFIHKRKSKEKKTFQSGSRMLSFQ